MVEEEEKYRGTSSADTAATSRHFTQPLNDNTCALIESPLKFKSVGVFFLHSGGSFRAASVI